MEINDYTGVILAATVFITVAIGHEFVRKFNYLYGTKPGKYVYFVGVGLFFWTLFIENQLLSAIIGVTAITIIWDGYEFYKQEDRIRKGEAPENPNRPVEPK